VIDEIGPQKVAEFVTDIAVNIQKLRSNISLQYSSILDLRCMPHFMNLITEAITSQSMQIVSFFSRHHRANALLKNGGTLISTQSPLPELKGFVATRWNSTGSRINSMFLNEQPLRKLCIYQVAELSDDIHRTVMQIIGKLKAKNVTLADCTENLCAW